MATTDATKRFETLTERQKEVLRLFCKGTRYKDIGAELFISVDTVKTHVGNIYEKLGLTDLPPKKRAMTVIQIYCPLLDQYSTAMVVVEQDPEPVPPDVQKMVEEDERALTLWESYEIIDAEVREIPPRHRIGGISPWIWIIIGGGIVAILFSLLNEEFPGAESNVTLASQPDETAGELLEPTDTPLIIMPSDTPVVIVVTATFPPFSATPFTTNTPMPSVTTVPSPTTESDTPSGSILEVGQWWKEDGVWLRLSSYEFGDPFPSVRIILEFWNNTASTLLFSWNTSGNLSLRDNNGHVYPLTGQFTNGSNNENVDAGELIEVRNDQYGYTVVYQDDALYSGGVSELILTVIDFSRINQAEFRIPIN